MNGAPFANVARAERIVPAVRVVIDTGVLRSAVWGGRASTSIADAWIEGRLLLCVTEPMMSDYFTALLRLSTSPLIESVLTHLRNGDSVRAFVAQSAGLPPEDHMLACARLAEAAAIVTHERALLDLVQVGSVALLSPGAFVRRFLPPGQN